MYSVSIITYFVNFSTSNYLLIGQFFGIILLRRRIMAENKKLTKRQLQAKKTKQDIYDAALSLIKEQGVDNFTINDICRQLDISVGAFYHYFKSKDQLLGSIYYSADNSFAQTVDNDANLGHLEKLLDYYRWYGEYNETIGLDFCQKFYNGNNVSIATYKRENLNYLESILIEMSDSGILKEGIAPEILLHQLNTISRGVIFEWCINEGKYDLVTEMQLLISTYMSAVTKQ